MLNVKQMPIVRPYDDKRVKIFWDILQLPKVNVEVHASPSQFDNDDDGEEDKEVGADDDNAADDADDDCDDDDDDGEEDKEVVALNYDISDGIFPKLVMMMMMMMEKRTKKMKYFQS